MDREERYRKIQESKQNKVSNYRYNSPIRTAKNFYDYSCSEDEDDDPNASLYYLARRRKRRVVTGAAVPSSSSEDVARPSNKEKKSNKIPERKPGRPPRIKESPSIVEAKRRRSRRQKSPEMMENRQEVIEEDEEVVVIKKSARRRVIISSDEEEQIEEKPIVCITLGDSSEEEQEEIEPVVEPAKNRGRNPRVPKIDKKPAARQRKKKVLETDPSINPAEIHLGDLDLESLPAKPPKKRERKVKPAVEICSIFPTPSPERVENRQEAAKEDLPTEKEDMSMYLPPEDEAMELLDEPLHRFFEVQNEVHENHNDYYHLSEMEANALLTGQIEEPEVDFLDFVNSTLETSDIYDF